MAEKIEIASLAIDFNEVIKRSGDYKKSIEDLTKKKKELDLTTESGRNAFAQYDAQLRNLKKSYRDNQTFASALDSVNKDLTKTMSIENKGTQELRDSRRELNVIAKNIKGDTEEEIELRNKLNDAIDAQTEKLREQSSDFNASKDGIGEYEEGMSVLNGTLLDFIKKSTEAGGASKFMKTTLKGVVGGVKSLIKSTLAFIATPIGAVIAVVAGAFLLVKNAMNRSEAATNKIKKAISGFTGIIKGLLKFLEPLGNFLINGLVKGFELVEKGIFSALKAIQSGLRFLGLDSAANKLANFTNEVERTAQASKKLVKAELELQAAQRKGQTLQLEYQKTAEKIRQQRDNTALSISKRIGLNEKLGKVLKEQLNAELKIAQKALEVSELRIEVEGRTTAALDEQAEALLTISDIQERITGQESEQLSNRVALQKEAADKLKALREAAIKKQEEELELYTKSQGIRKKTMSEVLEFEKSLAQKEIEILDAKLKAKLISEEKYNSSLLDIQQSILQKQNDIAVDNARRELEDYNKKNKSKIDSERFLSNDIVQEEKTRLNNIAEQKRLFEAERLNRGVISETEYNDAINEINEQNRLLNEALELEREEAEKEKKAIDLENKLIEIEENFNNELGLRQFQLETARDLELKEAEKTGADKHLINKKYNAFQKTLDKDLVDFKNSQNAEILSGLASLFGDSSNLGKAFAIAEIANNTVQNSAKAFNQAALFAANPLTLPLAANANIQGGIIIASGAAQAAKVAGVKFGRGGITAGASHAQGGIKTPFGELEGGEAVINKKSTSIFGSLLSQINESGGGIRFAKGGIMGQNKVSGGLINYDLLAKKIGQANMLLPPPIVGVEDITEGFNNVSKVEEKSTF